MDENGAKRYSAALFEITRDNNKIDLLLVQLKELDTVFKENHELIQILNHPSISIKDKKDIIDKALEGRIDAEIIGLLYALLEHGKIDEFAKVYLHYRDCVYDYKGIKVAYVSTAVKMDDEEITMLKEKLSKQYSCTIEIENIIDPSIIGGVFLKVGDEVTDGTVKNNFQKMKKMLLYHTVR